MAATRETPDPETTPCLSGWREHLAIRLVEFRFQAEQMNEPDSAALRKLAFQFLDRATTGVMRPLRGPRDWSRWPLRACRAIGAAWKGSDVERAWVSTHAAEVAIVRGSTVKDVRSRLPSLVETCAVVMPADPRIATLRKIVSAAGSSVTIGERAFIADTLESAHATSDAQHVRVRSFRNVLIATTGALSVLVVLIGMIAALAPGAFDVCGTAVTPAVAHSAATVATVVCPTGAHHPTAWDVFVVELLGLLGAAITAALAIRKLSGTSTPYAVPLASLVLKLPIGAITALGGLLLLRAGFGASITALDQAQLAAYALIFGASQQLFMQFVDKQAKVVLDAATTPGDKSGGSQRHAG